MRTRILLLLAGSMAFAAGDGARAWVDQLVLPTWIEGPANPNPPFDEFAGDTPHIYPYTFRSSFTQDKVNHGWRALYLENDYLKCTILPDLGGHLLCTDKVNGHDLFYANPSVKKQSVALRGAWIAMGVEFNFPVGHSLDTVSPLDFAVRQNPDGSASAWISSVDRQTGLQMRVEFVLRPGSSLLTQNVTLSNPTNVRHRYYWWSTAGVQVEDEATTVVMPTNVVASYTVGLDKWPTSATGIDYATYGGQKDQNSLFAYGSKEPFLAIYNPHSRTGVAHYANPEVITGKKMWTWGTADKFSRTSLSDNNTTYMEIQSGLAPDQETFLLLNPQEVRQFTEYWMPVRGIDGISRVAPDGVLSYRRVPARDATVTVNAQFLPTHAVSGATVQLVTGGTVVKKTQIDLKPEAPSVVSFDGVLVSPRYVLEVLDPQGRILMSHPEGAWDAVKQADVKLGRRPVPDYNKLLTQADFVGAAEHWELWGDLTKAVAAIQQGLVAYPQSSALLEGAGRAFVQMGNFQQGIERLNAALAFRQDAEARYYLGVAQEALGDHANAQAAFAAVPDNSPFGRAAKFDVASIQARAGDYAGALTTLRSALGSSSDWVRGGAAEVALLRKLGKTSDAQARLAFWQNVDPSDLLLRFEHLRLAASPDDPDYFRQLAADPERVLNVATHLFDLGLYEDALVVLERRYTEIVDPLDAEPGRVPPQNYPLVSYYRAYASEKLGRSSAPDEYRVASTQSIQYVFPNRLGSAPVLLAAIARNPNDATAHALLGSLWFYLRRSDDAIAEWQKARSLNKNLPMLQRNLGRALLEAKNDPKTAIPILQEGLMLDPNNQDLQAALAKAQKPAPAPEVPKDSDRNGGKRKK